MDLSIIIVNWNARDYLRKCLESVYINSDQLSLEVFVVDNGSVDNSVDMIKRDFPDVSLIENKSNHGFGAANNQALRRCAGEFALILNPDTEVCPGSLRKMVDFLRQNPRAGAVGAKLLNPDGSIQLTCARNFPTIVTEFFWLTTLFRRFPKNRLVGYYLMSYWDHKDERAVDCLSGACVLVRRDILQKLDFFDEDYFMYGEDVDLCYRIKKSGWQIWYLPEAQLIHYGRGSSNRISETAAIYDRKAIQLFFKKQHGALTAGFYRLECIFISLAMAMTCALILIVPFVEERHKVKKVFLENVAILLWGVRLREG